MQYTTNYNYSLPESDDVLETASRVGYNNNFSDIDTQIKDANDDIDSIGEEVDTISTQISTIDTQISGIGTRVGTLETNVGTRPSGEADTLWDKIDTLFNPTRVTVSSSLQSPTVNAYQIGKMVYGCIEFPRVAMTVHSWLEIGTISQSPTANIQVPSVNTANGNFAGIVQIRADGIIRVYPSESASQGALSFTFSYTI